jgi:hypothetical protein
MTEELFKEGNGILLISAMYRGYDIAIDDSLIVALLQSVIKTLTNILKDPERKSFCIYFRTGENILKINSVNGF